MNKFRVRRYAIEDMDDMWPYERRNARWDARAWRLEWSQVRMNRRVTSLDEVLVEWYVVGDPEMRGV